MKLPALFRATSVQPPDSRRNQPSLSRALVPVPREVRRDYATIQAETGGTPPRGSLVDLLA